jgi:hypothetical protein
MEKKRRKEGPKHEEGVYGVKEQGKPSVNRVQKKQEESKRER